jgi:hypothetical protein
MAMLPVWPNVLNRSVPAFTEAQIVLEGEDSVVGRVIRSAKNRKTADIAPEKEPMPTFDYTVDGISQSTSEHELTPNLILTNAKIDPTTHYLVQILGREKKSYQEINDPIHVHECFLFAKGGAKTGQPGIDFLGLARGTPYPSAEKTSRNGADHVAHLGTGARLGH